MKVLVIPDLHEKTIWKTRVGEKDWDRAVFIGDYVDSWTHDDTVCINNLRDIIEFKKSDPENVILLLGNHELSYMDTAYRCSGFQPSAYLMLHDVLTHEYKDLFQVAYQVDNCLFTHAGVTKKWYNYNKDIINNFPGNLAEKLNNIQNSSKQPILHTVGKLRGGHGFGGITWADKTEMMEGPLPGYHQIVGHTPVPEIQRLNKFMGSTYSDRSVTFTDCLDKVEEYLMLEI